MAFDRMYSLYYERIRRFLRRYFNCPFTCDDIAQEVFVKIYNRKIALDPDNPGTIGYLCTVAKNAAIDHIRRQQTEAKSVSELIGEARMDPDFYKTLDDFHIDGCVLSAVNDAIDSFPRKIRTVYLDKNFRNKPGTSIARERKITHYEIRKIQKLVDNRIRQKVGPLFDDV